MPRPDIIAIDGPVAAGKTSVGKSVSKKLKYRFLDTGIMYRALTWLALERGVNLDHEEVLGRLARETSIKLKDQDEGTLLVNGQGVWDELRQAHVDRAVSLVARISEVRSALVEQQREIAKERRIVVVGRDIGTVVLPYADLKLFVVASVSERARRRHLELARKGQRVDDGQVLKDLITRDELDMGRSHSPLRPAHDAILLETDGMSEQQVIERVLELIGEE